MNAVILSRSTDLVEIRSLLTTLDISVIKEYVQRKDPHPSNYFGPGKVDEIYQEVVDADPDLIIVNDQLKPSQHHFLEMRFGKECLDRTGVILRIFAEHAHTPEAIAQVQLARLRYEQPFLREWIHKAKSGERPGFLAGGAYATDVYYEHARTHIRRIEKRLSDLSKIREVTRSRRHEEGFVLVALAGYTNAGKSALMNALCSTDIEVSSQLFSSLSTTTRKVTGVKGTTLMIDTVGFIKNLPPDLIDAFKSTLEEIFYSDLIFLVFDASEDDDTIRSKLKTSLDILIPEMETRKLVAIGTKTDRIDASRCSKIRELVTEMMSANGVIMTSSVSGQGLDLIRERISEVQNRTYGINVELPLTDASYSLISRLHKIADIEHNVDDGILSARILCNPLDAEKLTDWLLAAGGRILTPQ
jgi:GTP-binding protein HflX